MPTKEMELVAKAAMSYKAMSRGTPHSRRVTARKSVAPKPTASGTIASGNKTAK